MNIPIYYELHNLRWANNLKIECIQISIQPYFADPVHAITCCCCRMTHKKKYVAWKSLLKYNINLLLYERERNSIFGQFI